jgi:hypothetical protein
MNRHTNANALLTVIVLVLLVVSAGSFSDTHAQGDDETTVTVISGDGTFRFEIPASWVFGEFGFQSFDLTNAETLLDPSDKNYGQKTSQICPQARCF